MFSDDLLMALISSVDFEGATITAVWRADDRGERRTNRSV
jgi:hypothetical protein